MSKFPFLQGKTVAGKIVSTYRDARIIKIDKDFKFTVQTTPATRAEILDPNPLKEGGFPIPAEVLLILYRYEELQGDKTVEIPIVDGALLKGTSQPFFEDELKRIFKEEESSILLEGTIFHSELEKSKQTARESLVSFEQENFPYTKTSCRKIIEEIRRIVENWPAVNGSKSLQDKLKKTVISLYSFASIGGPHEGVTTREETELILKITMALLLYCNSILKSDRCKSGFATNKHA